MLQKGPKAATRVSSPKIRPNPPKNSAAMARNANRGGMCNIPVKNPMVPVKPYPPNHPSIFWAPCAKKITPKHKTKNGRCNVVVSGNQFTKHRNSLRGNPESGQQEIGLVSLYKDSFYRGIFCPSCTVIAKGGRLRFGIAVSTFLCRTPGLVRPFTTELKPLWTVNHPLRRGKILQEFCHGL